MNINYDGLEQEQRIRKIATSLVSNEQLIQMLEPYLDRREMACIEYEKTPKENTMAIQELERLITYCNTQIKLILLLN